MLDDAVILTLSTSGFSSFAFGLGRSLGPLGGNLARGGARIEVPATHFQREEEDKKKKDIAAAAQKAALEPSGVRIFTEEEIKVSFRTHHVVSILTQRPAFPLGGVAHHRLSRVHVRVYLHEAFGNDTRYRPYNGLGEGRRTGPREGDAAKLQEEVGGLCLERQLFCSS